jgi:hypothetical protein
MIDLPSVARRHTKRPNCSSPKCAFNEQAFRQNIAVRKFLPTCGMISTMTPIPRRAASLTDPQEHGLTAQVLADLPG